MGLTVQVQFPDGVREVAARFESPSDFDYRCGPCAPAPGPALSELRPIEQEGWVFQQTIGRAPNWYAFRDIVRHRSFEPEFPSPFDDRY